MSGRLENNIKIEKSIKEKLLVNAPKIVKDYSYNFSSKTATTKFAYIKHVIEFINFMSKELGYSFRNTDSFSKIKTSDINRYMDFIHYNKDGKEMSPSTRATKLFAVSNFFEFLIDEDIIEKNPCRRVIVPKDREEKEVISMTPNEINIMKNNILNGCGSEHAKKMQHNLYKRDLVILALGCRVGMRVTSISEIDIDDIDFENKTIKIVEKGNKIRTCYIGDKTMNLILEWMKDREEILGRKKINALLISNRKTRITSGAIRALIKKYSNGVDKHISPHKMRSSCATNLYNETGDIYLVKEVLGHKNLKNTERYAKVSNAKIHNAIDSLSDLM